jgi:hypothetical protein
MWDEGFKIKTNISRDWISSEVATLEVEILKQIFSNVAGKTLIAIVSTNKTLAHPYTLQDFIIYILWK